MKKGVEKTDLSAASVERLESITFRKPSGLCAYADGGSK